MEESKNNKNNSYNFINKEEEEDEEEDNHRHFVSVINNWKGKNGGQSKHCDRGHWRPVEDSKLREFVVSYGTQQMRPLPCVKSLYAPALGFCTDLLKPDLLKYMVE
ncbi:hypothetical protein U1Q18_013172, partial [Sarracenia purpurea var. burkii]